MYPLHYFLSLLVSFSTRSEPVSDAKPAAPSQALSVVDCNCTLTQSGNSYPVSALQSAETAVEFYSYGNPNGTSANTGLELANTMVLFLYEDTNTGIISLFIINDIHNDGSGGSSTSEVNCAPDDSFIALADDGGEFTGSPPLFTGNWNWTECCTDGGIVENIGCDNTINIDLLASNGIDSIVWLTGDVNDPDHILLNFDGESFTVSCGSGGICCPVGFDTEVLVTNATCPDTPNGEISLMPQDGTPGYFYSWSNGGSTAQIDGLLPGTYLVTITDSQGCTDELSVVVDVSPGDPDAEPAEMTLCSENPTGIFDLTTLELDINGGTGFDVLWFENSNMSGAILNPSNYNSGSTTVYAVVDNGSCQSEPVAVMLELIISPIGTPASLNACESDNGQAIFDLSELDGIVSGGNGSVSYYLDDNLSFPIADPTSFLSGPQTIYAVVNDGTCLSEPVEIELNVDLKPDAQPAQADMCGNEYDEAEFDLTLLENEISGGNGTVLWFLDSELALPINAPTEFITGSDIVYAVVFDDICYSDPVPVTLTVHHTPEGTPVVAELCDDGTSHALFNLFDYAQLITGGQGGADFYYDIELLDQIPFPESFYTVSTVVYATVNDGTCISLPVTVTLQVIESPVGNPTFLETCADANGLGTFDLTAANTDVSGGTGTVMWFEDAQGNVEIDPDTAFVTGGTTVYGQISNGGCLSPFVPVSLLIVDSVSANPAIYPLCEDGSGMAVFDLTSIDNVISNGSGQVNWFLDINGTQGIAQPDSFPSGDSTVYANVLAGECTSDIVPVMLITLSSPTAMDITIDTCGNSNGEVVLDLTSFDTLISGSIGDVQWFSDAALTMPLGNPSAFLTSDTVVFAVVVIGTCISEAGVVTVDVASGLNANAAMMEVCIPEGDTVAADLTSLNTIINGGTGQVNWFFDPNGAMPLMNPSSLNVSSDDTVYANVSQAGCVSGFVQVVIAAETEPVANSLDLQRCGDSGGQVTLDLLSMDTLVSEHTGIVSWFGDASLMTPVGNPAAFVSGDTILYAVVTNGNCVSDPAPVTLVVVDSLTANAVTIEACLTGGSMTTINLTESDFAVSGGGGVVYWFTDGAGQDTIQNPTAFVSGDNIVYASVSADGCQSNIAPITIDVSLAIAPQVVCNFASIDSASISWFVLSPDVVSASVTYEINGTLAGGPVQLLSPDFGVGGLAEGDDVTFTVTVVFNAPCDPLSATISCETEECPAQSLSFTGLPEEVCVESSAINLFATPLGGQFSGDGVIGNRFDPALAGVGDAVIQYTWADIATGCVYVIDTIVEVDDELPPPQAECLSATMNSVTFALTLPHPIGYFYRINNGPSMAGGASAIDTLRINGLFEGDIVTLNLWSSSLEACGNSDTVTVSCQTFVCPDATLVIDDPGQFCSEDEPVQLTVTTSGLPTGAEFFWSGSGVSADGIFDPVLAGVSAPWITVTASYAGCIYEAEEQLTVSLQQDASFEVVGTPCLDSALFLEFTGVGFANSDWNWELDGAEIVEGMLPRNFSVQWSSPGNYTISLQIEGNICSSETFSVPVQIDAPLDTPQLECLEESYYELLVGWADVPGATSYVVTSSLGNGIVNGNTYSLRNLPDDTTVVISVTADGNSACGNTTSVIQCRTLKYIPVVTYVPNIFSPNDDSVNDIVYVQGNSEVLSVTTFRVFDRWGGLVYEDFDFLPNDPAHGWDGTWKGELLDPGVFVYMATIQTTRGEEVISGDITLIR